MTRGRSILLALLLTVLAVPSEEPAWTLSGGQRGPFCGAADHPSGWPSDTDEDQEDPSASDDASAHVLVSSIFFLSDPRPEGAESISWFAPSGPVAVSPVPKVTRGPPAR